MPDNILRVGAEFDIAPIVEGTQKAVAAFDDMAAKSVAAAGEIKTGFESAAQADAAVISQVTKGSQEALRGFADIKGGGILAFDALRAKLIETTGEVARIRTEILQTNDQATLAKLREELRSATAAMTAARFEMRALGFESRETTEKLNLMGETVGVKIPAGIGNLLGRLPLVQSAMAAAFSATLIALAVDTLLEVPDAIGKIVDKLVDWDEQAKKTYEDQVRFNREAITEAVELTNKKRELSTIGTEGARKEALEQDNLKAHLADIGKETTDKIHALEEHEKKLKELKGPDVRERYEQHEQESFPARIIPPEIGIIGQATVDWATRAKEKIKEEEKAIADLRVELQGLAKEQSEIKEIALPKIEKTQVKTTTEEQLHEEMSAIEQKKRFSEAYFSAYSADAKREYDANRITLEAEVLTEKLAVEQKLEAERKYASERLSILSQESKTGKDVKSEQIATRGALQIAELQERQEIKAIDAKAEKERLDMEIANGDARINAAHRITESILKAEETRTKHEFSKADSPVEIEASAKTLIEQNNKLYDDRIAKLKEETSLLTQKKAPAVTEEVGTSGFEKQVAEIEKTNPQVYRQLIEANAQIKILLTERSSTAAQIEEQSADKTKAIRSKEGQDEILKIREELTSEEAAYRENITHIQELYTQKRLTLSEFTMAAKMFAQEEYQARVSTLAEEGAKLKEMRAADLLTEEAYNRKLEELAAQAAKFREQKEAEVSRFTKEEITKREQALHSEVTKMADEFTSGINKMITHEQSFSRSLVQMAGQIELSLIDQGIKRVAVKYGEEFATMIAGHLGFITKFIADHSTFLATLLGIETTNKAAKETDALASKTLQVQADAGVSFAGGFASVMEALPFPVNVSTAPEVAAAAATATIAGGLSFEKGGIMPEGHVPAFVRPQEAVLPVGLTQSLTGAVPAINNFNHFVKSGGGISPASSSGGDTNHKTMNNRIHIEMHNHGGSMGPEDVTAAVKKALRSGALKLGG